MIDNIKTVMGLWHNGFIDDDIVIKWADRIIIEIIEYNENINLLSLYGPLYCSKLPNYEFPSARKFTYEETLALKFHFLDIDNKFDRINFVKWIMQNCMGESLSNPLVMFGYMLEDCSNLEKADLCFLEQIMPLYDELTFISDNILNVII